MEVAGVEEALTPAAAKTALKVLVTPAEAGMFAAAAAVEGGVAVGFFGVNPVWKDLCSPFLRYIVNYILDTLVRAWMQDIS